MLIPDQPDDVAAFIRSLHHLGESQDPELRDLFVRNSPIFVTRAPGRLDVMGGIADYSGALVLQLPIAEATIVALQRDSTAELRIHSPTTGPDTRASSFTIPMADLLGEASDLPASYEDVRRHFTRNPDQHWAAYAAGAFVVLAHERGVVFPGGARILITSRVPEGKGVSSSAAIEVAVMQAVCAAFGIPLEPRELALLCQKVENRVVGAPCGVMDQMASACGKDGQLLAILCQPAELQGAIPIPQQMAFWGLDSGVRHSVSGADYGTVRVGAFMGYRILADAAGFPAIPDPDLPGLVRIADPQWNGCLANVPPSLFEQFFRKELPDQILGSEFLARFGGTTDPVTRVDPARTYPVRAPTAHPIYEHFRVKTFASLLEARSDTRQLELLGELMYQSHASYSACGLGSEATDCLVALVREAGPERGLFGAKITGGGSGGTVAILGRRDAGDAVRSIAKEYARGTGSSPYLFAGSSPGAAAFGWLEVTLEP